MPRPVTKAKLQTGKAILVSAYASRPLVKKHLKSLNKTGVIEIGQYSIGMKLVLPHFNKEITLPYLQKKAKDPILANLQRTTEILGAIISAFFFFTIKK